MTQDPDLAMEIVKLENELDLLRKIADKADICKSISQNLCGLCRCSFCAVLKRDLELWKKTYKPKL